MNDFLLRQEIKALTKWKLIINMEKIKFWIRLVMIILGMTSVK